MAMGLWPKPRNFWISNYLPVQLLSDKKIVFLNFRIWPFHWQGEKGGRPKPRNKKKPDARPPHERRLCVWSYPRGRGIILRCYFNYLSQCKVKKGNFDPSGGRVHRGADVIIANFAGRLLPLLVSMRGFPLPSALLARQKSKQTNKREPIPFPSSL